MRALLTGITGFVGRHLAAHLAAARPETELVGVRRWRSAAEGVAAVAPAIRLVEGDLLDAPSLLRAVDASRPDAVFHLAASSSVASSWNTPAEMFQANVLGTLHLLEAVRRHAPAATVVVACSAESYGQVAPADLPLGEEQPLRPVSPYAVTKAAVDMLAYQYYRAFGVRTVRLRLFNTCGPGQADRFVVAALARQVAEIEAGRRPPTLRVGNLAAVRDFVDVRDVAAAYLAAVERALPGEAYNVAAGAGRPVRELVERLLAIAGTAAEVSVDEGRLRPTDIAALVGDATRFRQATGWRPEVPFERTLADTLAYWRARVASG